MSEKLEKCPFCGNDESVTIEEYDTVLGNRYRVVCPVCMATVDNGFASKVEHAIRAWNRRADE